MNKQTQILLLMLVTTVITVIAGCVDNGDVGTVIANWNKVVAKEDQIANALNNAASSLNTNSEDLNVLRQSAQRSNSYLESAQRLLEEEDALISEFSGSTVKVTGDAKIYANDALTNIRQSYSYNVKAVSELQKTVSNFQDVLTASESGDLDRANVLLNEMTKSVTNIDSYTSKSSEYTSKANDAIKKLEALQ